MIDRDTKRPGLYRLAGSQDVALQSDAHGWMRSDRMQVRFRTLPGKPPRLVVEDAIDSVASTEI